MPRQKYTLDFSRLIDHSTPPQIWPYLAVLVLTSPLTLRGACHPNKSLPAMPTRDQGTGLLLAEMKEYDA